MQPRPSFIHVGTITAAHGVRGQVKIRSLLSSPDDLLSFGALTDAEGERVFHIAREGFVKDQLVASIRGVNDRNAAEALKGTKLYAASNRLPDLPENAWYHADLVGLTAQTASGERYGKIIAVHNFGAGDIIEIDIGGGKTEMLPFKEPYVGKISVGDGWMAVNPPDYIEPEPKP